MPAPSLLIKHGRKKPILNQHPWVFSGAIKSVDGNPEPGDIIDVRAHDGHFLGRGYYNPASAIRARLLTWEDEPVDEFWWQNALNRAVNARRQQNARADMGEPLAYRLINAENDFLPGLIVDRYGQWLVMQALTLGIDRRKHMLADILATLVTVDGIYERSDVDVRAKEGLDVSNAIIWGKEPPERVEITDVGQMYVDIYNGHKTGYYLDQAPNHRLLHDLVTTFDDAPNVLSVFSYTGGFGISALLAGADRLVSVDSSSDALALAESNLGLNPVEANRAEFVQADAFDYLRAAGDEGDAYDVVVLDPPKFAHNKGQVERASRGYKDINLHAFDLAKSGGYLLTFSCSGAVSADLFQKIVFGALADSGRQAQITRYLGPGADHPVALTFPEGAYLKGLMLRVY